MKRFILIAMLTVLFSVPGNSQLWINFNWNTSYCNECVWMGKSLHFSQRQLMEYHNIIHQYGQWIAYEANCDHHYWNSSAQNIYDLRMERDYLIQNILTPSQFTVYINYTRQYPRYIHDYRDWYTYYAGYRTTADFRRYEDRYWRNTWDRNYRPQTVRYNHNTRNEYRYGNSRNATPNHNHNQYNNQYNNRPNNNQGTNSRNDYRTPNNSQNNNNNRSNFQDNNRNVPSHNNQSTTRTDNRTTPGTTNQSSTRTESRSSLSGNQSGTSTRSDDNRSRSSEQYNKPSESRTQSTGRTNSNSSSNSRSGGGRR